jgi:hypothetical protein
VERDEAVREALRYASGDEWIEAAALVRPLREAGFEMTPAALGRVLSRMAEAGDCVRDNREATSRYRVPMRAVEVAGPDGLIAGRLLLVQVAGGLELDLAQLADVLPRLRWRVVLGDRDARTVRAAVDESLWWRTV